jgi:methionyl-tRNA formyltransferase
MKISNATSGSSLLNVGEVNAAGEVGTGSGSVQLLHVIPAGKREMSVKEWLNGFKLQPGERFE